MGWMYIDEVPTIVRKQRWVSSHRFAVASFLPSDHMPDHPDATIGDLKSSIRSRIKDATGEHLTGPIRLLTPLRHFGIYFSPLCVYYVWDNSNSRVEAIVAEVSNTPWGEKHWYVLSDKTRLDDSLDTHRCGKQFHVSPFMEMDHQYDWKVNEPGGSLVVSIQNRKDGELVHTAGMQLERRPFTDRNLFRMMLRYPLLPLQSLAGIYYQAFLLWMKRLPYIPHPDATAKRDLATQGVGGS
jgi:DUF1365 family protein